MKTQPATNPRTFDPAAFALVWIDAEGARILRWRDGVVETRIHSDIPVHERSTYHVRHDPSRHGGGGRGADDVARRRSEHVRRFLARIEAELLADGALELIGTGELCEELASHLRRADVEDHHRHREIVVDHAPRPTSRQFAARLKASIGKAPVRGGVGSYRWTGALPHERSGRVSGPRRVVRKAPRPSRTAGEVEGSE